MPRTPRRRVAEGVYRDRYSLTATVKVGRAPNALSREHAFPDDTPIEEILRWREKTRVELRELRPTTRRGSLEADVRLYLERVKKRPASWKSKRSELRAWCAVRGLGSRPRHAIQPKDIDRAIATWREEDVSLKTILNRCRTLHHLYVTLAEDKRARTPLDNVDVPRPPKRKPQEVDVRVIARVEKNLRRAGDPFVHAFYMVVASTGLRNSQVNRVLQTLTAQDVRRRIVFVEGAKGGEPIPLVLNRDQVVAFDALLRARIPIDHSDRFREMDATKYARAVRAAGWPKGVRPYNARHAVGIALAELGAEDADIQAQLGHSDLSMVRRHYTGVRLSKMKRISEALEGRLGWAAVPRPNAPSLGGSKPHKDAKSRLKTRGRKTA